MPVAAVVFDWYATLAVPNDDFWTRLPELIAEAGGAVDRDALHEWEFGHPDEHLEWSADEATYRAWQRDRLGVLFTASGRGGSAAAALLDHVDDVRYVRHYDVFPEVAATLAELRRLGVTVGVCSNWDWDLERHLVRNGLVDLLDVVVCSAQVGWRKPHRAIFDEVVERTGAPAAETVFVGDNWRDDVGGALRAGLRPVHVARTATCGVTDHDGVACVSSLDGVAGVIGLGEPREVDA